MTRQRRVILEELRKLSTHPTATDLYHIVRQRLERISLGTVYRNLELLAESGEIRKVQIGGREARFDPIMNDHNHAYCIECGRIDNLPESPEARSDILGSDQDGWQIRECRIELVGICPDCSASSVAQNQQLKKLQR
jgi:Fur family ferric uptake transcriptional regulator